MAKSPNQTHRSIQYTPEIQKKNLQIKPPNPENKPTSQFKTHKPSKQKIPNPQILSPELAPTTLMAKTPKSNDHRRQQLANQTTTTVGTKPSTIQHQNQTLTLPPP